MNHLKEDPISSLEDYYFLEDLLSRFEGNNAAIKAKNLLNKYGNIAKIISTEQVCLQEETDLSKNTLDFLTTVKECIRRVKKEQISKIPLLKHPKKVFEYCKFMFQGNYKEVCAILYLNHKYQIIHESFRSDGNIKSVKMNIKDIARKALIHRASGIILVHNHPSGILIPSHADIEFTQHLSNSLKLLDITLLDHLIINEHTFYSFKTQQLLSEEVIPQSTLSAEERMKYIKSLAQLSQSKATSDMVTTRENQEFQWKAKDIKDCIKAFRNIGIEVSQEWVKSGAGLSQYLPEGSITYNFQDTPPLGKVDLDYLKMLNSRPTTYYSYMDKNLIFLSVNKQYEAIFNLPINQILGKHFKDLVGEQGYIISKNFLNKALSGEEVIFSYPWNIADHKVIYLEVHYIPDPDFTTGEVRGIYTFLNILKTAPTITGQYVSEAAKILPCIRGQSFSDFDNGFFIQSLFTVYTYLQSHHIKFNHQILLDIMKNIYENFKEEKSIDHEYLEQIIKMGVNAGIFTYI